MNLFRFTSAKAVDGFARQLARDFFNECERPDRTTRLTKAFEKRADQALVGVYARAKAFREERGLGVINRARFAKSFQDELVSLGVSQELVTRVTTAMVAAALAG